MIIDIVISCIALLLVSYWLSFAYALKIKHAFMCGIFSIIVFLLALAVCFIGSKFI